MASATSRRLRAALALTMLLLPSAGGASGAATPVYIWRDAADVVRFSAPPPSPQQPR